MSHTSIAQPAPGEVLTLEIEKPAAGGRMLARLNGRVVLVGGAIPGERVRARVERTSKGVVHAETIEVLTTSEDRRAAHDPRCGGQVFAHVAYPRQLRLKGDVIQDGLLRIGKVTLPSPPTVVPSPEHGYRIRSRLHVKGRRFGFFREGSHEICNAVSTGQLSASTGAWIAAAERLIESRRLQGLVSVDIAESIDGTQRACHLEVERHAAVEVFYDLAAGATGLSASRSGGSRTYTLAGTPTVIDRLRAGGDDAPRFSLERDVRAFFQGNRFLLQPLVTHVLSFVGGDSVLDLYAGVGLFGLAAAAAGCGSVTLVEGDTVSGASLLKNVHPFESRARVESMPVEDYLSSHSAEPVHTVIVDPPRSGLSRAALGGLLDVAAARIVYVSCDIATLARDLRALLDAGYELLDVSGFDLFPNTAHIETVAVLDRAEEGRAAGPAE